MYVVKVPNIEESGFLQSYERRCYLNITKKDTYYHILTELFVNDFILLPTSIGYLRNLFILMSSEPSMQEMYTNDARTSSSFKICSDMPI